MRLVPVVGVLALATALGGCAHSLWASNPAGHWAPVVADSTRAPGPANAPSIVGGATYVGDVAANSPADTRSAATTTPSTTTAPAPTGSDATTTTTTTTVRRAGERG